MWLEVNASPNEELSGFRNSKQKPAQNDLRPRMACPQATVAAQSREKSTRPLQYVVRERSATLKPSVVGRQKGSKRSFGVLFRDFIFLPES